MEEFYTPGRGLQAERIGRIENSTQANRDEKSMIVMSFRPGICVALYGKKEHYARRI
jgi:hypothetical protein